MRIKTVKIIVICLVFASILPLASRAQENADAVYQKLVKEYTLYNDGSFDLHYHKELKLLTYYSFQRLFGETFIVYNPEFQELKINYSYTIMADGKEIQTPENAFNELLPRFAKDAPAFNNLREMVVTHTGTEKGAVIILDYTIHSNKEFMPFLMENIWIGESIPVQEMQVIVRLPEDIPLHYKAWNIRTGPDTFSDRGATVYTWLFRGLKGIPYETMANYDKMPRLVFSTARDLTMAYFSFVNQEAFRQDLNPEISKTVEEIAATGKDELDIILDLQKLVVKDIKTINVSPRFTVFRCRTPIDVWNSGYGTSLEKSILLARMLLKANISAFPVAEIPSGFFDKEIGDLNLFKTFLVQVNPKKYSRWYLSATSNQDRNYIYNLGHKVMIQLDAAVESLRVFEEKPGINDLLLKGEWIFKDTTEITGQIEVRLSDYASPYITLRKDSSAMKNLVSTGNFSENIKEAHIEKLSEKNLTFILETENDKPATSYNGYFIFQLPVLKNGIESWRLGSLPDNRTTPLRLPYDLKEEYKFRLELPSGYTYITKNASIEVKNEIGTLYIRVVRNYNVIEIERKLQISKTDIGPGLYNEFIQLKNAWYNKKYREITFKINK